MMFDIQPVVSPRRAQPPACPQFAALSLSERLLSRADAQGESERAAEMLHFFVFSAAPLGFC